MPPTARPFGVLEASFWTAAYRAEVAANSLGYFRSRGIGVLAVPELIVVLRVAAVISDRAVRRKLGIIEPITALAIVASARKVLDSLADQ